MTGSMQIWLTITSAMTPLSTISTAASGTATTTLPREIGCVARTPRPPLEGVRPAILHDGHSTLSPASQRINFFSSLVASSEFMAIKWGR